MIVTLIEKGWFTGSHPTPIESAYRANFESAARLISIENAGR